MVSMNLKAYHKVVSQIYRNLFIAHSEDLNIGNFNILPYQKGKTESKTS